MRYIPSTKASILSSFGDRKSVRLLTERKEAGQPQCHFTSLSSCPREPETGRVQGTCDRVTPKDNGDTYHSLKCNPPPPAYTFKLHPLPHPTAPLPARRHRHLGHAAKHSVLAIPVTSWISCPVNRTPNILPLQFQAQVTKCNVKTASVLAEFCPLFGSFSSI